MDSQAVDYLPTFAAQEYNVMFVSADGANDSVEMVEEEAGAGGDDLEADAEAGVENGERKNQEPIAPLFDNGYVLTIDPDDSTDYTTPEMQEKIITMQKFFIGLEQVMPSAIPSSTPWRNWDVTLLTANYNSLLDYHKGVALRSNEKLARNQEKREKIIKRRQEREEAYRNQADKSQGVRHKSREHHVRAASLQGADKMRESALELTKNSKLTAEEKKEKQKNRKKREEELEFLMQKNSDDEDDRQAQHAETFCHGMIRADLQAADEYHDAQDKEMERNVDLKPSKEDKQFINDKKIKMKSKKQKKIEQASEDEEESDLDVPLAFLKHKCKNQTDKKDTDDKDDTGENGAQALGTLTFENIIV